MARPTKKVTLRNATKDALLKALSENKTDAQYYLDQVDQYMEYYDNLELINAELNKINKITADNKNTFVDLAKEKRLITKEMRAILIFLGLTGEKVEPDDL